MKTLEKPKHNARNVFSKMNKTIEIKAYKTTVKNKKQSNNENSKINLLAVFLLLLANTF